jgi:hypothetical protein
MIADTRNMVGDYSSSNDPSFLAERKR